MTDLASGLRVLVDRPFLLRPKWVDQQGRANRVGAHPAIVEFERKFIARMAKKHGVPMFAHNMVRTPAEQRAVFVQGHSQKDGSKPFAHMGCAVDIVHSVKAWDLERASWSMLGHIGKELATQLGIRLTWGGDWSSPYDPAHWELANWRELVGGFPFSGG